MTKDTNKRALVIRSDNASKLFKYYHHYWYKGYKLGLVEYENVLLKCNEALQGCGNAPVVSTMVRNLKYELCGNTEADIDFTIVNHFGQVLLFEF